MTIIVSLRFSKTICDYYSNRHPERLATLFSYVYGSYSLHFKVDTPTYQVYFAPNTITIRVFPFVFIYRYVGAPGLSGWNYGISKAGDNYGYTRLKLREVLHRERVRLSAHLWKRFTVHRRRQRILRDHLLGNLLPSVLITFIS